MRFENDHDIHLVIGDPSDQHKTMISEIVDPTCSGAITSPDVSDLKGVRESFARTYNPPPGQKYWPASDSSILSTARAASHRTQSNFTRYSLFDGSNRRLSGRAASPHRLRRAGCAPASICTVVVSSVDELHAEFTAKQYKYNRPGIQHEFGKSVTVIDPFHNEIRFLERNDTED